MPRKSLYFCKRICNTSRSIRQPILFLILGFPKKWPSNDLSSLTNSSSPSKQGISDGVSDSMYASKLAMVSTRLVSDFRKLFRSLLGGVSAYNFPLKKRFSAIYSASSGFQYCLRVSIKFFLLFLMLVCPDLS